MWCLSEVETLPPFTMEVSRMFGDPHSAKEYNFIMERFPTPQHEQTQQQHEVHIESQGQTPQNDASFAETQVPVSEFSQDFYTESAVRRVQPPRARRTDFGKHTADELIIEAIERAGT
jgi:hypothetical protein